MLNTLILLLSLSYSQSPMPNLSYIKPLFEAVYENSLAMTNYSQLHEIKDLLQQQAPNLSQDVIRKVMTSLKCVSTYNVDNNNILTVVDYSLPSNQKRLWVFDLIHKKLLFYTYVSHGIKSGTLYTNFFSNKYDSKASSMGIYTTNKAYYGREGLSLRLDGLDRSFNDNASNRSIVMHGGWYVDEGFIKKYGRPGRSWGCPALPPDQYQAVINTIKDKSLIVVYYPNENWFTKSKFLNCEQPNLNAKLVTLPQSTKVEDEKREDVLFAEVSKPKMESPILTMSAASYQQIFHTQAPLGRMLRRQINKEEYIALSNQELQQLATQNNKEAMNTLNFVIPVIYMVRGYYETQMKIVNLGKIKDIHSNSESNTPSAYTVSFEQRPSISLRPTNKFIRWLGL